MRRARVLVLCTLGWASKVAGVAVPQCPSHPSIFTPSGTTVVHGGSARNRLTLDHLCWMLPQTGL